jgi:hypothetical protein
MKLRSQKRPIEDITEDVTEDVTNVFDRKDIKRRKPSSEPIIGTQKVEPLPQRSINEETDIPLKKEDILRIISSQTPLNRAAISDSFSKRSVVRRQEVPTIYSSYFFRKDIITEFSKNVNNLVPVDKLASFPLTTYHLYNKDDILNNTTYRPDILGTRIMEKSSGYSRESTANMRAFINFLSKNICTDIGSKYTMNAVRRAIDLTSNEAGFDILVASTRIIENVSLKPKDRLSGIVAFIIVELGECKKYPAAYSINLICTDTKPRDPPVVKGIGSVLMGAFLYTILSHPENRNPMRPITFPQGDGFLKVSSTQLADGRIIENCFFNSIEPLIPVQQIAVLELALAYTNTGGLCMYEKFGFTYDQTMFSNVSTRIDCFEDRDNLPMLIDFNTKPGYSELDNDARKLKVARITAGIDRGFEKSIICSVPGDKQKLLGHLKTIMLYIDNTPGTTLNTYDGTAALPEIIEKFNTLPQQLSSRRSTSTGQLTINNIINYIENPPQIPDSYMENNINELISVLPKKGGYSRKNRLVKNMKSRKNKPIKNVKRRFTKRR